MTRRIGTIVMVLALLLGGGVGSCLAAIDAARALQCCSKDCPRPTSHNPNECCSVGTATMDGEVAPAAQLTGPAANASSFVARQVVTALAPADTYHLSTHLANWSPPPRLTRGVLCSLQI
jgi:hypothetical protein